jgi:hypothetical protein
MVPGTRTTSLSAIFIKLTEEGRLYGRLWGSHGGEYEDCCLLGCSTV